MIPTTRAEGKEAIELLSGMNPFHAALLDAGMPGNGSHSLGEEIRKINKTLPLIALTFPGQQIRPELYESSLAKPIRQSDLFNALKDALAGQFIAGDEEALEKGRVRADIRVLIAEDNVSNQKVILSMLKRLGYSAHAVSSGKEALQALAAEDYDVVLMDVRMPEMDGLEATRIIRQNYHSRIKIIAITAYALKGDKERCLEAGMDDYISKPVRMEELEKMLRKHQLL